MRPFPAILIPLLCAWPVFAIPSPHIDTTSRPSWRRFFDRAVRKISPAADLSSLDDALLKQSPIQENRVTGQLRAQYGDDIVLRFTISTAGEAIALQEAADTLFLDVWEFNENWADVRLAKNMLKSLLGLLPSSLQHAHAPLMRDLSLVEAIAETHPYTNRLTPDQSHDTFTPRLSLSSSEKSIFFNDYQPLSVIVPWMKLLASYYPTHARLISIGKSYEGRDIHAMRLGVHPKNNDKPSGPRRTIVVSGGLHAREWISTSTVNYVAYSLITQYGKMHDVTNLLEEFDWVFIPTLNPDGYVYTWETDRLWRKNRQPTSLRFCQGIDLDRSFGFHWDGETSKDNPCSESFAGDAPFEGVEAKAFADWSKNETENNNVDFVALLDLHSYSQQVLYPYSYSCEKDPPSLEDLEELALGLAKAMRMSHGGHVYKVTSACEGNVAFTKGKKDKTILPRMESGGGSALDWFYHELQVEYSFQLKLRDTGNYGFLLPRENILPTGREVLEAVHYLGRFLDGKVGLAEEGVADEEHRANPTLEEVTNAFVVEEVDDEEQHNATEEEMPEL